MTVHIQSNYWLVETSFKRLKSSTTPAALALAFRCSTEEKLTLTTTFCVMTSFISCFLGGGEDSWECELRVQAEVTDRLCMNNSCFIMEVVMEKCYCDMNTVVLLPVLASTEKYG